MAERRRWVIHRAGERPINTNAERQGNRYKRATATAQWRSDFALLARAQNIPKLDQVRFIIVPHYKTRQSLPDVGSCSPSAKAGIDGIVDAGVLVDDTPAYVVEHVYRPPVVDGWDGLELIIEEVPQ